MIDHPFRSAPAVRPDVLVCAGLDPSGGAGFIADVRVVTELGGRPIGVVTALTVQDTTGVVAAEPISADLVREQLERVLSDVEVKAVKIGMLGSSEVARAIGQALALTGAPVVWDPVVHPTLGEVRLLGGALGDAMTALLPHLALVTPNAAELALLSGEDISGIAGAIAAGEALAARLGCAVLIKGGHLQGAALEASHRPSAAPGMTAAAAASNEIIDEAIDLLCLGGAVEQLRGRRIPGGEHVHGTGCALSSAIAAHLARGAELVEACRAAKAYVAARIAQPARPGRGAPAIV